MAIYVGVPSGGVQRLSEVDVSSFTEGYLIGVLGSTDQFQLTVSDAAVDGVNVESVKNNGTMRWVKFAPGATGTPDPTPNAVPESLDDGKLAAGWLPPGLNDQVIYVSPSGDDDSDGLTQQTAMETGYEGYLKLVLAGGGRLRCASGTEWGGPVPGQGCWLRGDGVDLPGWLPQVPAIIEFEGESGADLFSLPGKGFLRAGSNVFEDFSTKPAVWLACGTQNIVHFKNVKPKTAVGFEGLTGNFQNLFNWRIGWDYPRDPDTGAIAYMNVTSASRTAPAEEGDPCLVTLTVDLPAGVVVTSASRAGNVTSLVIAAPGPMSSFPHWNVGTKFWLESATGAFPSGAYTVLSGASLEVSDTWNITYADPGSDQASIPVTATVHTTQTQSGEYVDFEQDEPEGFPSCMYKVQGVGDPDGDEFTLTLYDWFGGHGGVADAVADTPFSGGARVVHQERGFGQVLQPDLINCANWYPTGASDVYAWLYGRPGFDYGTCTAMPPILRDCALQGYYPVGVDVAYDEDRHASVFAYGGKPGMASMKMQSCTGNLASLRYRASSLSGSVEIDLVSDTGNGSHPPIYSLELSAYVDVNIVKADAADVFTGNANPVVTGSYDPSKLRGVNLPEDASGIMPVIGNGLVWQQPAASGGYEKSPWAQGKAGWWTTELRLAGKHPAGNRQISPTMARFQNLVDPVGDWTVTHGSIATGHPDPMGGTGAVKLTADAVPNNDMVAVLRSGVDADTSFEAGGRYVIAGWVNFPAAKFNTVRLIRFDANGDVVWTFGTSDWDYRCPAAIPGWQYVMAAAVVESASASQDYDVLVAGPPGASSGEAYLFGFSAFYIPPDVSDSDVAEYIGTLRAQPQYLPPGMAGTFEGQKFIAHGGLGVLSSLVTVAAPGTADRTLIIYDENGDPLIKLHGEAP